MREETAMTDLPDSIAIAGAWGYIGRKFLDVALRQRIRTFVYDPGRCLQTSTRTP